jgi:hypothetical protein
MCQRGYGRAIHERPVVDMLLVAPPAAFWRAPTVLGPTRERVHRVELRPPVEGTFGVPKVLNPWLSASGKKPACCP